MPASPAFSNPILLSCLTGNKSRQCKTAPFPCFCRVYVIIQSELTPPSLHVFPKTKITDPYQPTQKNTFTKGLLFVRFLRRQSSLHHRSIRQISYLRRLFTFVSPSGWIIFCYDLLLFLARRRAALASLYMLEVQQITYAHRDDSNHAFYLRFCMAVSSPVDLNHEFSKGRFLRHRGCL